MSKRTQKDSGEERVTAKSGPMMSLIARAPSTLSSSASESPEREVFKVRVPGVRKLRNMIERGNPLLAVTQVTRQGSKTKEIKGRSPTMRLVSRTHTVALVWLFDRVELDSKVQIKFVATKNQLADLLTKGNFRRDEWNHLLHLLRFLAAMFFQLKRRTPCRI